MLNNCINICNCLKNNKDKEEKEINNNKIKKEKSNKKLSNCLDNKTIKQEEDEIKNDDFVLLKNNEDEFILL